MSTRLALIGGRGYTGAALLALIAAHPRLELAVATSGSQAGQPIHGVVPEWPEHDQRFQALAPEGCGQVEADVWVLALPNGASSPWIAAISENHPDALILDLGADYRFNPDWAYGLTEWNRQAIGNTRRIANPGCYATGAQFGLMPIRDRLTRAPVIFGVSGHSGAGRTPSPRNDPERLRDNLIPYSLTGHVHEEEVSTHLGLPVRFHPHVAAFFRGISLTLAVDLSEPLSQSELLELFSGIYENEPLIKVGADIPEIREVAGSPRLMIGGFAVDPRNPLRSSFVVVLDNLLKGAASQAVQNINLALGFDELTGMDR